MYLHCTMACEYNRLRKDLYICHIIDGHQLQILVTLRKTARCKFEYIEGRILIKYSVFKRQCSSQSIQQEVAI